MMIKKTNIPFEIKILFNSFDFHLRLYYLLFDILFTWYFDELGSLNEESAHQLNCKNNNEI